MSTKELQRLAGPTYLWERYSAELGNLYRKRRQRAYVKDFRPSRLQRWLQNQVRDYCRANGKTPLFRSFTIHDFRGTAMSAAIEAGASIDDAANAFLCHPATIKAHYLVQDRTIIEDRTLDRMREVRYQPKAQESGSDAPSTSEVSG